MRRFAALGWWVLCGLGCGVPDQSLVPVDLTAGDERPSAAAPESPTPPAASTPDVPAPPEPPTVPPVSPTGPLVEITVDASRANDLAGHMAQVVVPFLQRWYPAVADQIARPTFEPPGRFSIVLDPSFTGLAQKEGDNLIRVQPAYVRAHPDDLGMWLHEATHVIQSSAGRSPMPSWAIEGIADWAREYVLRDRPPHHPTVGEHYESGYAPASFFLEWIRVHHQPEVIRRLMAVNRLGTYSADFFLGQTGKGLDILWKEMMEGVPLPGPIHLVRSDRVCLELSAPQATMQACREGTLSQHWGKATRGDGAFILMSERSCLGSAGTTEGSALVSMSCGSVDAAAAAYLWKSGSEGELVHQATGLCLTDPGNGRQVGSAVTLRACSGAAGQRFSLPY